MARGINKVTIIGNMAADPEIRRNESGSAMMTGRIATSEQWKDKNTGEKRENTEWVNLVAYGKTAELFENWVRKGDRLYIEGKLQTREYQKDGVQHYMTQVVVKEITMLSSKAQDRVNQNAPPKDYPQDDVPY